MTKKVNPFEQAGRWYKGNTHLHTTNSDGSLAPEEICALYHGNGYDFLALTDHMKRTEAKPKIDNFLLIPSVEYDHSGHHVVALNTPEIDIKGCATFQEALDRLYEVSALVIIAHPYWSGNSVGELLALNHYHGIEIYNNTCQNLRGKGYATVHWDELLQQGRDILGFASDDTHHRPSEFRRDDLLGSFIMVKAEALTVDAICAALKAGAFYSSTGAVIENVAIRDDIVTVECGPAADIDFIAFDAQGDRVSGIKKPLTRAEFKLSGYEKYLRIEVTDAAGRKAWTNPLLTT